MGSRLVDLLLTPLEWRGRDRIIVNRPTWFPAKKLRRNRTVRFVEVRKGHFDLNGRSLTVTIHLWIK